MEYALTTVGTLKAQGRILSAIMLHDIKTRIGGNEFGFLFMAVGWPLAHIVLVIAINTVIGRLAPYGESPILWFATGMIPFAAFHYMARFTMLGIVQNRSLLSFPVVKVMDLILARAIVEVLTRTFVILIVFAILWSIGVGFMPVDIVQASLALLSMMLLGLGFGVVNAVIAGAVPFWIFAYILFSLVLWFLSGVIFVPDALPEVARTPLSYVPTLQGVEWMRSAYYEGYGASMLDKPYLIAFGVVTLFIGLILERLVRGKIIEH
jgi:capsular polysaccharide transport system permease protein